MPDKVFSTPISRKNNLAKRYLACYIGILPFFVLLLAFVFWPMLQGVGMSFTDWSMNAKVETTFVGMENYKTIFSGEGTNSQRFLKSLMNLFCYVPLTIGIGLGISLILALIVRQMRGRLFSLFRSIYYVPTVLPLFLCTGIWQLFMASDIGIVSSFLSSIGLFTNVNWTQDTGYAIAFVILVDIWNAIGFNFIIFSAGMQDIPQELYEAAETDGASTFQQMIHVTLPMLEPVIFFVISYSFISALQVYDIPWIVTSKSDINSVGGSNQVMLFPVMEMVRNVYNGAKSGLGRACAEGVVLMGIIMVVTLVIFKLRKKKV